MPDSLVVRTLRFAAMKYTVPIKRISPKQRNGLRASCAVLAARLQFAARGLTLPLVWLDFQTLEKNWDERTIFLHTTGSPVQKTAVAEWAEFLRNILVELFGDKVGPQEKPFHIKLAEDPTILKLAKEMKEIELIDMTDLHFVGTEIVVNFAMEEEPRSFITLANIGDEMNNLNEAHRESIIGMLKLLAKHQEMPDKVRRELFMLIKQRLKNKHYKFPADNCDGADGTSDRTPDGANETSDETSGPSNETSDGTSNETSDGTSGGAKEPSDGRPGPSNESSDGTSDGTSNATSGPSNEM